jgi:hypothetical protein
MEKNESTVIVFSSGTVARAGITDAIRNHLSAKGFIVTLWTEGFFPPTKIALYAFLKQLICFDAAVVVLGADDVRADPSRESSGEHIPRDNVILELGGCLARMGNERTFIVCPNTPTVKLPSYFEGIAPMTYDTGRTDGNLEAAVGSACEAIARAYNNVMRDSYLDLPAAGLAYGYFWNFVKPTYDAFNTGPTISPKLDTPFTPEQGFALNIVMPTSPLLRDQVEKLFLGKVDELPAVFGDGSRWPCARKVHFDKPSLLVRDGRNISIYTVGAGSRGAREPFAIYDVPTTLTTSDQIIQKVDQFWGGGGDLLFRKNLTRREARSFKNVITSLIHENGIPPHQARTITMEEFCSAAFDY